jgi:hypothetical protein
MYNNLQNIDNSMAEEEKAISEIGSMIKTDDEVA